MKILQKKGSKLKLNNVQQISNEIQLLRSVNHVSAFVCAVLYCVSILKVAMLKLKNQLTFLHLYLENEIILKIAVKDLEQLSLIFFVNTNTGIFARLIII